MTDIYTGPRPDDEPERSGASKVNAIVYRHIYQVLDGRQSVIPDPGSRSGRLALSRLGAMGDQGVEGPRLAVISGLAHIDRGRRAEGAELETHEELAVLMEEAPGA